VVGVVWSEVRESSAGGILATVRVSNTGQVRADAPEEKRYPSPPGWKLAVIVHSSPRTKRLCPENLKDVSERNREEWMLLVKVVRALTGLQRCHEWMDRL
jgi:hypothetical protein